MNSDINKKVMTAQEAVNRFIKPGTHIAFGGFTILRRPMAIAREIVRQGIGDLFVTMNGGTLVEEMLAGAGLIKWLETTYLGLEGGMPVAYAMRQGIEMGNIELVEDYSNWSFAQRTLAGKYGLPFMPCMGDLGSDILNYDTFGKAGLRGRNEKGEFIHPGIPPKKYEVIDDPFEGFGLRPRRFNAGEDTCGNRTNAYRDGKIKSDKYTGKEGVKILLVPPLLPEVCVIHAQRVAIDGTVRIEGLIGPDIDQSLCGRVLIVECERICSPEELRAVPEHNQIASHFVHAIVEQPFGAYPSAVPNYYDYDYAWFKQYAKEINHQPVEKVREFWQEHVGNTTDEWEYLYNRVGMEKLFSLRTKPEYHYNPEIDRFK
ncbi:MAG: glutaconate CoA-transferase, subunit [Thermoanaerobacteraceae bacterium]|nr:glutaconate CoA-transferase, subunit [Thermoanaerobacteraceae bacterium]